jgi:hypothetical protein
MEIPDNSAALAQHLDAWMQNPPVPIARVHNLPGSYLDHEIEAARSGQVVECCGAGNERRGPVRQSRPMPPVIVKFNHYLAACAIARDELDLPEWVAYQFAVGFEHVHIFDNESVVPVADRLKKWISSGKVTTEPIKGRCQQNRAYTSFLKRADARWVAFIDIDEFVLPHGTDDLKTLLPAYEPYGGLGVSWATFGSGGRIERHCAADASPLVIESYTHKGPPTFSVNPKFMSPYYKSIVQTVRARGCPNPHFFNYRQGHFAVNERGVRLRSLVHAPAATDLVQINHYMTKSLEDWRLKQARRGGASGRARTDEEWKRIEAACNAIEDTRILRFVPKVRALMAEFQR